LKIRGGGGEVQKTKVQKGACHLFAGIKKGKVAKKKGIAFRSKINVFALRGEGPERKKWGTQRGRNNRSLLSPPLEKGKRVPRVLLN